MPVTVSGAKKASLDLEQVLVEWLRADRVRVPPYPAVAAKLQALTAREGYGIREITPIVAADATLSAAVLRQANAANALRTRGVDSLEAAVSKLGAQEIVRLAIAQTVGRIASAPGPLASLRREQWRASLISATLCQALATRRGVRPELAFMAGLLHDFGSVVVVACLEEIAGTRELPDLSEDSWREVVQNFHVDFGMIVASRWRLPEPLSEVMASHHHPESCLLPHRPLVQLVALVDQVIAAFDRVPEDEGQMLDGIVGLEAQDHALIAGLMPRLDETLATFEASAPQAGSRAEVPSKVQHASGPAPGSWPVDIEVELATIDAPLRACALAPNAITVRSPRELRPNWLARLTLVTTPEVISMLVNVKACDAADGAFLISMQPFGLDGPAKAAWIKLLATTRRALGMPGTRAPDAGQPQSSR